MALERYQKFTKTFVIISNPDPPICPAFFSPINFEHVKNLSIRIWSPKSASSAEWALSLIIRQIRRSDDESWTENDRISVQTSFHYMVFITSAQFKKVPAKILFRNIYINIEHDVCGRVFVVMSLDNKLHFIVTTTVYLMTELLTLNIIY